MLLTARPSADTGPTLRHSTQTPRSPRHGKALAGIVGALAMGLLACCGSVVFFSMKSREQQEAALAEADKLYASKPAEAVVKYKEGYPAAGSRKTEVLQRIVDHEAKAGNTAEATKWIEKGLDDKLTVDYTVPAAKDLHAKVQKDRADKEAAKKAAEEAKRAEREANEQAKKAGREKKERYGTYTEAMSNAEKAIRKNLPFPNNATFHALGRPVVQNPDGSWQVSGTVTTRDSFGKPVTYQFFGAMLRAADGSWGSVGDIILDPE